MLKAVVLAALCVPVVISQDVTVAGQRLINAFAKYVMRRMHLRSHRQYLRH